MREETKIGENPTTVAKHHIPDVSIVAHLSVQRILCVVSRLYIPRDIDACHLIFTHNQLALVEVGCQHYHSDRDSVSWRRWRNTPRNSGRSRRRSRWLWGRNSRHLLLLISRRRSLADGSLTWNPAAVGAHRPNEDPWWTQWL